MKRAHQILSFSAAIGAGLLAASAFAQQPAAPAQPAPAAKAAPAQTAPQTEAARPRGLSKEDRSAFFDARIAAIHAGLKLTPDQEKLWAPVETAVRDMSRQMMELREQRQAQAAPADPIERMARMGEMSTKRGQAMSRLAEAARPLYASLSDDQRRRLRTLMHGPRGERGHGMQMGMGGMGMMGVGMGMNEEGGRHGRHHREMMNEGGRRGDMHGEGRGMHGGSGWNDWR